jgi:hypothetical protein
LSHREVEAALVISPKTDLYIFFRRPTSSSPIVVSQWVSAMSTSTARRSTWLASLTLVRLDDEIEDLLAARPRSRCASSDRE